MTAKAMMLSRTVEEDSNDGLTARLVGAADDEGVGGNGGLHCTQAFPLATSTGCAALTVRVLHMRIARLLQSCTLLAACVGAEWLSVAPLGEVKWTTVPSSWNRLTSSMPGMVFTPSRLRVLCNLLSSVEVVLWTAFFFLEQLHCQLSPSIAIIKLEHCQQQAVRSTPPHCPLSSCPDHSSALG